MKDKFISVILLLHPTLQGNVDETARTYLHPLCEDKGYSLEGLLLTRYDKKDVEKDERKRAISEFDYDGIYTKTYI